MKVLKISSTIIILLAVILIAGYTTGNQPERDSVGHVEKALEIELESNFIDVGEVTLHVVLAGPIDGEPVLLLHGFPEFWYAWRKPMAILAKAGYRVIVPDQRGYNLSDKPNGDEHYNLDELTTDMSALVKKLGYEDVNLAAHDWGGGVAWWMVLHNPELVRRFFVIDTPHPSAGESFQTEEETNTWYRDFIRLPFIPTYLARLNDWQMLTDTFVNGSKANSFSPEDLDQFRSAWDHENAINTMVAWYRADNENIKEPESRQVDVPTMVVIAPNDFYIPSDLTVRSMPFLNNGELLRLEQGSHWIIQEQPEMIAQHLIEFIESEGISTTK